MTQPNEGSSTAADALSRVPLFEGLHPEFIGRLAEIAGELKHPAGTSLWKRGEAPSGMYVLIDGGVRIDGVAGLSCEISAGDCFGEDALVDETARDSTAICDAAARLVEVRREDFEDLLFVDRDLAYELLWRIARAFGARGREPAERAALLVLAGKL